MCVCCKLYMVERIGMSCNGCRILRKGCNENCILRQSLQAIHTPQARANATLFVAKFFGRAGLISFLSSVPQSQRPSLFQSLLFEACGRTVNPVNGAVGLLSTGNWHLCQSAVETVLSGGVSRCLPEFGGASKYDSNVSYSSRDLNQRLKRKEFNTDGLNTAGFPARMASPSKTTTLHSGFICHQDLQQNHRGNETKLLRLFT